MPDASQGAASPIARHRSTPQELKDRLAAERAGDAHLIYRDGSGRQVIWPLPMLGRTVTIGRRVECDISLEWDGEVSRVHAELQYVGGDWILVDDGLSRNGSYVNGERLRGRHVLGDWDTVVFGQTAIVFRAIARSADHSTRPGRRAWVRASVNAADHRLLVALCRPLKDPSHALPASNQAIAQEMCVSVAAVKRRLSGLFARFEIGDLPQSEKRTRLAILALQSGIVTGREF